MVTGQMLLELTELELAETLRISSLGKRKNVLKAVMQLKAIMARTKNGGESILISNRSLLQPPVRTRVKSQGGLASFNSGDFQKSDMLANQSSFLLNRSMNKTFTASKKLQIFNPQAILHSEEAMQMDPDSMLALGQDTGLLVSMKENGFDFFVDHRDIKYDAKTDLLGSGGFGDVYKATWLGTMIALKRFKKRTMNRSALKDFIKEIEMLNQLRHPNIVLYMGVAIDPQNHFYMVTEFVGRGSLFEMLHTIKMVLDDDKIFKIARQCAMALLYLSHRALFHCDLKSQNILVNEDWTVKLCDFGLSRYQEKFESDNQGKIGTPHWMAPEILRGEMYTEKADVYSFGVILWEMLTGEIPYMSRSIP